MIISNYESDEKTNIIKALIKVQSELENLTKVRTTFYHTSGEWIATQMLSPIAELGGQNLYQSQGSAITYFRRYQLASMLGLCDVDDIDAQGEQTKAYKIQSDDLDF